MQENATAVTFVLKTAGILRGFDVDKTTLPQENATAVTFVLKTAGILRGFDVDKTTLP